MAESRELIVISGAGSGIGLDAAIYLAEQGYTVIAGVRKKSDGDAMLKMTDARAQLVPTIFDVTDEEQVHAVAAMVDDWISNGDRLRAVFSNAGITAYTGDTSCEATPISTLERLAEVNYLGAARFIQAFLPQLRNHAGTVIINSAMMAHTVLPFSAGYAPSKAALEAWADSLRREIRPYGVKVVIVELGGVVTNLQAHNSGDPMHSDLYPAEDALAKRLGEMESNKDNPKFSPRRVSELLVRILDSPNPKPRYRAGGGAHILGVLGDLPDRVQDAAFARMFSRKPKDS